MAITKPPVAPPLASDPTTQADSDLFESPSFLEQGYTAPGGLPEIPLLGHFNWLLWWAMAAGRYHQSRGIPDWDEDEDQYVAPAAVWHDDEVWVLVGTATTGLEPSSDLDNWQRWLKSPIAAASAWATEIWAWMNANKHRGFGLDHQGLPAGRFVQWMEDWCDKDAIQITTVGGDGYFGRWNYRIVNTGLSGTVGGAIYANGPWLSDLTTHPWGSILGLAAGDDGVSPAGLHLAVVEAAKPFLMMPDAFASIEGAFSLNNDGGALPSGFSAAWGFGDGGFVASSSTDGIDLPGASPNGSAYFARQNGASVWRCVSRTPGGAMTSTDTVSAALDSPHRGRIEIVGPGASDDGTARVLFYVDGALVANHAHDLTNAPLSPFFRSTSGAVAPQLLNMGPVRCTARLDLGDKPII